MEAQTRPRIWIVENDWKTGDALCEGLGGEGYDVVLHRTAASALLHLDEDSFDVIVLDMVLQPRDGFCFANRLREKKLSTPVLILTADEHVTDRIRAIIDGPNDYLVKPFFFAELLARLRALLRRNQPGASSLARGVSVSDRE